MDKPGSTDKMSNVFPFLDDSTISNQSLRLQRFKIKSVTKIRVWFKIEPGVFYLFISNLCVFLRLYFFFFNLKAAQPRTEDLFRRV